MNMIVMAFYYPLQNLEDLVILSIENDKIAFGVRARSLYKNTSKIAPIFKKLLLTTTKSKTTLDGKFNHS